MAPGLIASRGRRLSIRGRGVRVGGDDSPGAGSYPDRGSFEFSQEADMRLVATEYLSLDGAFEEPGKWSFPFFNDDAGVFEWSGLRAGDPLVPWGMSCAGFA